MLSKDKLIQKLRAQLEVSKSIQSDFVCITTGMAKTMIKILEELLSTEDDGK